MATYSTHHHRSALNERAPAITTLHQAWRKGVGTLFTWIERHNARVELLRLNEHILKDIGLSAADIDEEAHKPFWRE